MGAKGLPPGMDAGLPPSGMKTEPSPPGGKNLPLESLRGLAAVCVALHNFSTQSPLTDNRFIHHSYLMVDLFFVLSGYVIAMNYSHRLASFSQVLSFQVRRFWRLYPLHAATLALYVLLECAKYAFMQTTAIAPNDPPFVKNNLSALINNLFLTQAIFLDHTTFNTRSWSISTEFYTYLAFALLVRFTGDRYRFYAAALSLVAWVVVFFNSSSLYLTTGPAFFRCLHAFFLGALLHALSRSSPRGSPTALPSGSAPARARLFPALAALSIAVSCLAVAYLPGTPLEYAIPALFGCMIYCVARCDTPSRLSVLLSHRFLVYLGTISYSVYMLHGFIWFWIRQISRFVFHVQVGTTAEGRLFVDFGPLSGTLVTLLGLCLILLVSGWSYRHIESRFRRAARS